MDNFPICQEVPRSCYKCLQKRHPFWRKYRHSIDYNNWSNTKKSKYFLSQNKKEERVNKTIKKHTEIRRIIKDTLFVPKEEPREIDKRIFNYISKQSKKTEIWMCCVEQWEKEKLKYLNFEAKEIVSQWLGKE